MRSRYALALAFGCMCGVELVMWAAYFMVRAL